MASNWAIVVGINDYQHHPERKLKYAVNDAQRFGDFLSKQAGFGEANVIRCLGDATYSGSPTYPTCSNLLRSLRRDLHPDRLGSVSHLWFYFSGHGVSRNGRDYLITADCWEDEIERFALPLDEVITTLRLHKNAEIVLVLDACRQILGRKDVDSPIGKQTTTSAKERAITTIFSCDYGEYSYELEALQQGAFTYALVEGLSQHTLPSQLEHYLQQQVPQLHQKYRRDRVQQTPRIRIEPASKVLQSLLPDATTAADIDVLIKQAKADELEEHFETAKKLWWQVIDVSQSITQKQEARSAIERIDRKIARLGSDLLATALPQRSTEISTQKTPLAESEDDLSSERFGANYYAKLRDLLKAQDWYAADQETADRMCEVMGRQKEIGLEVEHIQKLTCQDLRVIDQLWVKYSQGRFGLSIQHHIWQKLGGNPYADLSVCNHFCHYIGWRDQGNWRNYDDLEFKTSAPIGHLPVAWTMSLQDPRMAQSNTNVDPFVRQQDNVDTQSSINIDPENPFYNIFQQLNNSTYDLEIDTRIAELQKRQMKLKATTSLFSNLRCFMSHFGSCPF